MRWRPAPQRLGSKLLFDLRAAQRGFFARIESFGPPNRQNWRGQAADLEGDRKQHGRRMLLPGDYADSGCVSTHSWEVMLKFDCLVHVATAARQSSLVGAARPGHPYRRA